LSYITSARTILDYVDNVNHKVYFDSDEFIELIRFYKNNWERMPPGRDSNDRYAHYRNDTIQLYRTNMNSLDEYNHLKNVFREDVTFVGYPTLSDNGAIIRANIAYGISEKSKHADIAWQFLKRMLADDIQYPGTKYRHVDTMPLTVSAMNKYIDYMLNHISVYGDNGGVWGYEKPLPEDHVEGFVVEITREEIDSIIDYMSNAKSYNATDYNFLWFEIIFEELRYDKTPEEIAKVIQNRAFIYINEKR